MRVGSVIQAQVASLAQLSGGPADLSPAMNPALRVVGIVAAESEFPSGAMRALRPLRHDGIRRGGQSPRGAAVHLLRAAHPRGRRHGRLGQPVPVPERVRDLRPGCRGRRGGGLDPAAGHRLVRAGRPGRAGRPDGHRAGDGPAGGYRAGRSPGPVGAGRAAPRAHGGRPGPRAADRRGGCRRGGAAGGAGVPADTGGRGPDRRSLAGHHVLRPGRPPARRAGGAGRRDRGVGLARGAPGPAAAQSPTAVGGAGGGGGGPGRGPGRPAGHRAGRDPARARTGPGRAAGGHGAARHWCWRWRRCARPPCSAPA